MPDGLGLDDAGGTFYPAMLTRPITGIDAPGCWGTVRPQPGSAAILRRREPAPQEEEITAATTPAPPGRAPPHIEDLADLETVRAHAQHLARAAQADLQVTVAAPQAPGDWHAAGILHDASLAAGLRLCVLYHVSAGGDPALMTRITRLSGSGAPVRTTQHLPPVLLLCDQQAALLLRQPTDPGKGGLCVRDPAMVASLGAMFATAWDAATPLSALPRARDAEATELTAGESALLRLLAAGLTDESAARQLGISVRTVRRQMAALMIKLGAASRFQAGHKATERGWLSDTGPDV